MNIPRLVRTVAPLRREQIVDRMWRRFARARPGAGAAPVRVAIAGGVPFLGRAESILADGRVRLFGEVRGLDAGWCDPGAARLWRYHLHYHEGVRCARTPMALRTAHIARWIAENPAARGDGWEPYPIARRTVNWAVFAAEGGVLPEGFWEAMAAGVRSLAAKVEWHLGGNHLLADAGALAMAGLVFEGAEATRWRAAGERILAREIPRQFLADGGHDERSPAYHALLTEELLDLANLGRRAGVGVFEPLAAVAARALGWLAAMTRPDGRWPAFNDCVPAMAPGTAALIAYGAALGLAPPRAAGAGMTSLAASGFHRFDAGGWSVWIDAGRLGPEHNPGHGHAGTLGFELFAQGRPLIVDTGVSTYAAAGRRAFERSTAAHNTVEIGGASSAELWGAFRVGRRPRVWTERAGPNSLTVAHDGYRHRGAVHARTFAFGPGRLTIDDEVRRARAADDCVARVHLAPGLRVELDRGMARLEGATIRFVGAREVRVADVLIAADIGRTVPSVVIEARFGERLRTVIEP